MIGCSIVREDRQDARHRDFVKGMAGEYDSVERETE